MITQKYLNDLSYALIGCAIEVHKGLGPGLLESVYHKCYLFELFERGIKFSSELKVPVIYKGKHLDTELRLDVLAEEVIIVELKAVDILHPLFRCSASNLYEAIAKA